MKTLVCIALIIAAFAVGVYVGRLPIVSLVLGDGARVMETETVAQRTTGGTVISTANLSTGQQKLLSTLGVDATAITVTPAMIACAEAKLGAARVAEITAGATPTFTEGVSLLACYR